MVFRSPQYALTKIAQKTERPVNASRDGIFSVTENKTQRKSRPQGRIFAGVPSNVLLLLLVISSALMPSHVAATTSTAVDTKASSITEQPRQFNIPRQRADGALTAFGQQADLTVVYQYDRIKNYHTNQLQGDYKVTHAVAILLANTGLSAEFDAVRYLIITDQSKGKRMNTTNSSKRKTVLAGLVGLFAAGGMTQAVAQGGEAATGQSAIDEIIVTANKREQKLSDVPMSISALTGKDLEAQGVTDLQSLSLAVPGLFVSESGSFQRRLSIRGIGNNFGSASLIGMYIDEASVASLSANQIDLRVMDLERVEVLKGPQGTLYGEGSVGGAIRYITKDPQLDRFAGMLSVDGSSTQGGDSSQEFKTVLNMPLSETAGLRFAGQYVNSGGWIDQPELNKEGINDYELFNIRTKLLWQPSDNLEVKASVIVHRNDTGAQNTNEDDNGNYSQALGDPSTPSGEDNYDLFSLSLQYDVGGIRFVSSTSQLNTDSLVSNWGTQCCVSTGTADELVNILYRAYKVSAEVFTQELRISSNDSQQWHWTTGLFYKDAATVPADIPEVLFGGFPITLFNADNSKSWAIFGEAGYQVTEQLEMGVGIRYFEDDREFFGSKTAAAQDGTFDSVNPKFYLSYHLNEDIHLFANAAKGFRSGGFNSGGPSYQPESVWSYELGSKMSFLDGHLDSELALFYSQYDDYQIIGITDPSVGNVTSNAGNADVKGIDLSLKYYATEHLELGFAGNYLDTEFTEIKSTSSSHIVGDPLDLVAKYGYSLWADYKFSWSQNIPGFIRIDYSRQGKSHYRNRSLDNPSVGLVYHSSSDIIDTLNARLGWERDRWSLELYGLNLLDENGYIGPIVIELAAPRPRPRTIGLNLGFRF